MSTTMDATQRMKRSTNACKECRSRKVKCSGTQPCDKCQFRRKECVFQEDRKITISEEYGLCLDIGSVLIRKTVPVYEAKD